MFLDLSRIQIFRLKEASGGGGAGGAGDKAGHAPAPPSPSWQSTRQPPPPPPPAGGVVVLVVGGRVFLPFPPPRFSSSQTSAVLVVADAGDDGKEEEGKPLGQAGRLRLRRRASYLYTLLSKCTSRRQADYLGRSARAQDSSASCGVQEEVSFLREKNATVIPTTQFQKSSPHVCVSICSSICV